MDTESTGACNTYHPDDAIVIVPLDGKPPFKIGDGTTWAVSGDGKQIAILAHYDSEHISNGFLNTLHLVDLDWKTKHYTETSYVLEPYDLFYGVGIAYSGSKIILQAAFDTRKESGGGGLGVFDTQTGRFSLVQPEHYYRQMQSTPNGSRVIFQTDDNMLIEAAIKGNSITTRQIVSMPVTNWYLGSDGSVLVQFVEKGNYQMIDSQNHRVQPFTLADPLQNEPNSSSGNLIISW